MRKIRVLIVDDHNIIREGLRFILNQQKKFSIEIEEASNRTSCLNLCDINTYDIVLMDINLGKESGIELTKELVKKYPKLPVIALTMHEDDFIVRQMLEAGAKGYLLKNTSGEEMNLALETVLSGEKYYSYKIALNIIREGKPSQLDEMQERKNRLSKREIQVIKLIVAELTNEEIAAKLNLSKRTVDGHRQNIIEKLNVRNTAGLVKFAIEANL